MAVRIYDAEKGGQIDEKGQGVALWPKERPYSWLMEKKRRMPLPMYNAQYRNDPSGLRGVRYDITWLQYYTPFTIPPLSELVGVQAGDPATSKEQSANYFGHCTVGKHLTTGFIYVLDFAFGHIAATEHLDFLRSHYDTWKSRGLNIAKVRLETGGPQQATTQNLIAAARVDPKGMMPIEEVKPKGTKEQRLDSLLPFYSNGTILFKGEDSPDGTYMSSSPGFKEFLREFAAFPKGGRDDVLDALFYAVEEILTTVAAAGTSENSQDVQDRRKEIEEGRTEEEKKKLRLEEYERQQEEKRNTPTQRLLAGRSGSLGGSFHRRLGD